MQGKFISFYWTAEYLMFWITKLVAHFSGLPPVLLLVVLSLLLTLHASWLSSVWAGEIQGGGGRQRQQAGCKQPFWVLHAGWWLCAVVKVWMYVNIFCICLLTFILLYFYFYSFIVLLLYFYSYFCKYNFISLPNSE